MASSDSPSQSSSKEAPKANKPSVSDSEQSMPTPSEHDENRRIPGEVLIGMPTTLGAVQSRTGRFKKLRSLESPTVKELYDVMRAEMKKAPGSGNSSGPPGPDRITIPIILPNNGHELGTCAGCGAEKAKEGGPLLVCAKCKERKYCGKKYQKLDWLKHKHSTCVQDEVAED